MIHVIYILFTAIIRVPGGRAWRASLEGGPAISYSRPFAAQCFLVAECCFTASAGHPQKNPRHFDSTLLTITSSFRNTGNVMAVSPGTSGLQRGFLTIDGNQCRCECRSSLRPGILARAGSRQAYFWWLRRSVVLRIL